MTKLRIGDRVIVRTSARNSHIGYYGTIVYWGEVKGYSTEYTTMMANYYYGIRLDECVGNTDGTFRGKEYFRCPPGFGVFLPPPDVQVELTFYFYHKHPQKKNKIKHTRLVTICHRKKQ